MEKNSQNEAYSEFESDCMAGAVRKELEPYGALRQKKIILACLSFGGLERYLSRLFFFLNETYGLAAEIFFCCPKEGRAAKECPANADFLICTGICNRDLEEDGFSYAAFEDSFLVPCAALRPKRIVLLGDYRIAGQKFCKNAVRAEGEVFACPAGVFTDEAAAAQGALEAACVAAARQYGAEYLLIRAGALLGPGLRGAGEIQRRLNAGEALEDVTEANDVVPYLYISDFLQALLLLMNRWEKNQIYHVVRDSMNAAGYEVMGLARRLLGERATVARDARAGVNYGMTGARLALKGFCPEIGLEQAVVMLKAYCEGGRASSYEGLYGGRIRSIQKLALCAMQEIDRVCRRFQIPYALGGGTLLGAVRHQGFIPWDEDADLIMEREAYEKFLAVAGEHLPDWLFLQTPKTDPQNHFYTKVRVRGTALSTQFTSKIPGLHQGVFVDIFCHDKTSRRKAAQKAHIAATIVTRSMVFHKWGNTKITGIDGGHPFLRALFTGVKNALPMRVLEALQFRVITWYQKKQTGYLYDGMGQNVRNGAFPQEWLKETVLAPFESCQFPIPKEYDKYLTYLYGDYQEKIPVRKRFDDSYAKRTDLGRYS